MARNGQCPKAASQYLPASYAVMLNEEWLVPTLPAMQVINYLTREGRKMKQSRNCSATPLKAQILSLMASPMIRGRAVAGLPLKTEEAMQNFSLSTYKDAVLGDLRALRAVDGLAAKNWPGPERSKAI